MKRDWTYRLQAFIIMAFLIWLALKLSGCVTDRKALGHVLTNPDLVAQVAKTLPPCTNDTTYFTDSVVVVDRVYLEGDTVWQYGNDTLLAVIRDTIRVKNTRTVTQVVTDNLLAQQWRDSADKYRNSYLAKDEQFQQKEAAYISARQVNLTRMWIIISLALALLISNGLWAYLKFKNP